MNKRALRNLPALMLLVVGLTLYALLAIWVLTVLGWGELLSGDFAIYTAAARSALQGTSAYYPYNIGYSFVYHPAVLSILTPLLLLDDAGAFLVWTLASLAAYGTLLALVFRRWGFWIVVLLALFAPFLENLLVGQINVFAALALVAAWLLAERGHNRYAGLALALAIVLKLSPALLLVYFLAQRRWQVILFTLIGLLAFTAIPLVQFGTRSVVDFVSVTLETLGKVNTIGANIGFAAMMNRLDVPAASFLNRAFLVLSVIGLTALAWRRASAAIYCLFMLVMLELSPLVWLHHFVFFAAILALVPPPNQRWRVGMIVALTLVQCERSIAQRLALPSGLASLLAVLLMAALLLAAYRAEETVLEVPAETALSGEPAP
jgi:alpha-1,2-mannosyltransferase